MMRLALLVIFYLLASVATAHAECAWVLWSQVKGYDTMLSGHGAEEECRLALVDLGQTAQQKGWRLVTSPAVLMITEPGHEAVYKCLPDTVDPRGPKGK